MNFDSCDDFSGDFSSGYFMIYAEVVHVEFLRQLTGKKARRLENKTWRKEMLDSVLQAEGKKSLRDYINKRQAAVADWVDLCPIFEVCAKETGYKGWGRLKDPWWRQEAEEKQLKYMLKQISEAAWERRRQ